MIFSMPTVYGDDINKNYVNQSCRKSLLTSYNKENIALGLIIVYSTEATGMPDQHNGVVINANITFSGYTLFTVINIPFVFKIDRYETNKSIHLNMELFYGRSDYQSQLNRYVLFGFACEIFWEM
jgi:hypothetical protein